jgi:hypothetical protein
MWNLPLLLAQINITWYLIPLAIVVSLVYSASRFELPDRILRHATGCFIRIVVLMGLVGVFLLLLSLWL